MHSVDFITIALVLIAGKTLAEQCFKVDQTDRKISAEELEKGLIDIVKEWKSYEKEWEKVNRINYLQDQLSLVDGISYAKVKGPKRPAEKNDQVVELIASISDKDTKLTCLKGYSVRQLLDMNTVLPSDDRQRKAEIKRRQTICNTVGPEKFNRTPVELAIWDYCGRVKLSCLQSDAAREFSRIKDLYEPFRIAKDKYFESHKIDFLSFSWRKEVAKAVLPKIDREQARKLKAACTYLCKKYENDWREVEDDVWRTMYVNCVEIKSVILLW